MFWWVPQKNQADGRQAVLKEEVKKVERELASDMYSNTDDKYNDMMIQLRVGIVTCLIVVRGIKRAYMLGMHWAWQRRGAKCTNLAPKKDQESKEGTFHMNVCDN